MGRHSFLLIIGVRFLYGLRIVGPVFFGMSNVFPKRFMVCNVIGAGIWAVGVRGAGYIFGQAIEWFFEDLAMVEKCVFVCGIVFAVLSLAWRRYSSR